ncbi:hypothetical protein JGH11_05125 [Dysgonomonas sp. Marseille-P4677]|uniref:DUF6882 domain-containing protein n=1 Tax=Dysgonomonas sp. Marseille-P4677 TaxID=2364790 RepID=UPI001911CBCB|nr:DUF6882 domain-containing protein [Dysgonomonas sp. Marseille-P4677]MBK5720248.1 hypothetical protein [Dysgonomonas sp. Marseille-P4677]
MKYKLMEMVNYDTLLEKHAGIAFEKQYNLAEIIGENNWEIDMSTGLIYFGDELKFPMQILGSYSFDSGTWLWAWANEASNIPDSLLIETNRLKEIGETYNIEFLTMPEYNMEPTDVHALGLIASGEFNSSAYYAGNYGNGILLLTLKDESIENVPYNEQLRILSIYPEIISNFAINHRRTFKNYLDSKGYSIQEEGNKLTTNKGEGLISAEFDDMDRLVKINGEAK